VRRGVESSRPRRLRRRPGSLDAARGSSVPVFGGGALRLVVRREAGARRREIAAIAGGQSPAVATRVLFVDLEPQRARPRAGCGVRGRAVKRARILALGGGHAGRLSAL